MWATSKVLLTFGILFLFLIELTGCSGGGISLIVSDIQGPTALDELAYGEYSVEVTSGTNITYQWHCNPPDAGEFYPSDNYKTRFTANETSDDIPVEIWVLVNADDEGPIMKKFNLVVRAIPGVNVGIIKGPLEVQEQSEHIYSIDTSGDAGLAFQWSTNSPEICGFDTPDAGQTLVNFHDIPFDALIEINVMVTSTGTQPVRRTIAVMVVANIDFSVMGIKGPKYINEDDQAEFTVKVVSDSDTSYLWSCDPPDAGVFDSPNSPVTGFTAGWIYQDTNVIISVIVEAEGYEPVQRDLVVLLVDYSYGSVSYWGPAKCDGMVIDSMGHIYITGIYYRSDLDPGEGVTETDDEKGAYISKFNDDGDFIRVSTFSTPSSNNDYYVRGYDLAVDESDNIYQVGRFRGEIDFQPGMPSGLRTSFSDDDGTSFYDSMFICKHNPDGDVHWVHTWSGICTWYDYKYNRGRGVAVDGNGDIYVVGSFTGVIDFDPGQDENVLYSSHHEYLDAFLCKFDTDGNFKWARSFGGVSTWCYAVIIDDQNNAYIRGRFTGFADFDPGPGDTIYGSLDYSGTDYISKFTSNGDFVWARVFGQSTYDKDANGLAIDFSGNVITSGQFKGTVDFDPGPGTAIRNQEDGSIYLVRFDRDGNFSDVITFGGETNSTGSAVSIDGSGNVYVSGEASTGDFKPGDGVCELGLGAYLLKLRSDFGFQWAINTAQGGNTEGKGIVFGPPGDIFVCIESSGYTDLNPTPKDEWVHFSGSNSLLMKFSEDGIW